MVVLALLTVRVRLGGNQFDTGQRDGVAAFWGGDDRPERIAVFQMLTCSVSPGNTTPAKRAP